MPGDIGGPVADVEVGSGQDEIDPELLELHFAAEEDEELLGELLLNDMRDPEGVEGVVGGRYAPAGADSSEGSSDSEMESDESDFEMESEQSDLEMGDGDVDLDIESDGENSVRDVQPTNLVGAGVLDDLFLLDFEDGLGEPAGVIYLGRFQLHSFNDRNRNSYLFFVTVIF